MEPERWQKIEQLYNSALEIRQFQNGFGNVLAFFVGHAHSLNHRAGDSHVGVTLALFSVLLCPRSVRASLGMEKSLELYERTQS